MVIDSMQSATFFSFIFIIFLFIPHDKVHSKRNQLGFVNSRHSRRAYRVVASNPHEIEYISFRDTNSGPNLLRLAQLAILGRKLKNWTQEKNWYTQIERRAVYVRKLFVRNATNCCIRMDGSVWWLIDIQNIF